MNKTLLISFFCTISLVTFAGEKKDTVVDGVHYNTIERYQGGKGSVSRICNMQVFEGVNRSHGSAIEYHQFPYGAISGKGEYFSDAPNGFWVFYYPSGQSEKQGKYTAVKTKTVLTEAEGDRTVYYYEEVMEQGWKFWDEWGNRIDETEQRTVNHKLSLSNAIRDYEQRKTRCEGDVNCENRMKYYKQVYRVKYPGEVFWQDSVVNTDKTVVYPISERLKAIDAAYGDSVPVASVNGKFKFTPSEKLYMGSESGDTIYLSTDSPLDGKTFSIEWADVKDISVRQRFETSVVIRPGGSHHYDLRNFMHGYTVWTKTNSVDSMYTFSNEPIPANGKQPFPAVSTARLQSAAREFIGSDGGDLVKSITTPHADPCEVGLSALIIEISGVHKISNTVRKKVVVIQLMLGC